jgi:hypothetical protein
MRVIPTSRCRRGPDEIDAMQVVLLLLPSGLGLRGVCNAQDRERSVE